MDEGDRFLVADVGATKTLLFLAQHHKQGPILINKKEYLAENYFSFEEVVFQFLQGKEKVKYAVIGACGPIKNAVCKLTNLPWVLDRKKIEERCVLGKVFLINDLELEGWGLSSLNEEDVLVIQKGKQSDSNVRAILSVGTGLGEGIVLEDRVIATEGGHADFAASTKTEIAFLEWMQEKMGHVSFEMVLSGRGIENIYEFFSKERNRTAEQIFLSGEKSTKDAISFFLQTLGKEAGNFALKTLCYGGIYLSGGILKKNLLLIQRGEVIEGFKEKGRFKSMLNEIPIYLIKGDKSLYFGGWNYLKKETK